MRKCNSLTFRLVTYWMVMSFVAFFTLPITVYIPTTVLQIGDFAYTGLEGWTTKRARSIVIASLARAQDGSIYIKRTEALHAHEQRNPEFRYAVFDAESGAVLPGSSPEIAAAFTNSGRVEFIMFSFHLAGDSNPNARGNMRIDDTPYGRVRSITYGSRFHWDDVPYSIFNNFSVTNIIAYLPFVAAVSTVSLLVVRRALAPLQIAAKQAARIDSNALNERLEISDLPSEISPFVAAMNGALERVEVGVAQQKRFLVNAAHELRTPITILCAHVENPDKSTFDEDIKKGVYRIRTIVEQLLSAARLSYQKDAFHSEIDLEKATLSVILDYTPLAIESGRTIEFDPAPSPVIVRANSWALESAVLNLIENAVRAEPMGGTVVVRILPGAVIEVVDHGHGVAPEDREAIFEPFWRKSDATRGAGLGLAITKELIDKQDGCIWVEETPGGGATFKIVLKPVEIVGLRDA